jgi:hypothetical protein
VFIKIRFIWSVVLVGVDESPSAIQLPFEILKKDDSK